MNPQDEKSDGIELHRAKVKMFWGVLLLILTPIFLFVKPVTTAAILRDVLLLITGKREFKSTDSK